jgi:hypothetical protein
MTRDEIQERKTFVLETWKKLWPKNLHVRASDLPTAAKVNEILKKKYNEHMRSDKLYGLRDQAIAELRAAGMQVPEPSRKTKKENLPVVTAGRGTKAGKPPMPRAFPPTANVAPIRRPVEDVSGVRLPVIVRDLSPEGASAISRALDELRSAGAANLAVEHSTDSYVVINKAR